MTATAIPATDKQTAFIAKLIGEKNTGHFGEDTLSDLLEFKATGTLPKKHASQLIDALLSAPKTVVPAAPGAAVLEQGIFIAPNGDVIKVQKSKSSGNLYAKVAVNIHGERLTLSGEVVKWEYVYAPGLIKHITPQMRMNAAQAEEYSLKFSQCMACGRALKAAKSVAAGIGPVCIKYFG